MRTRYTGGNQAKVYSKTWQKCCTVEIDASTLTVSPGEHGITFDCAFASEEKPYAKLEARLMGPPENVKGKP